MLQELLDKISRKNVHENKMALLRLTEPDSDAIFLELGPGDGSFTLELGEAIGTDKLHIVDVMDDFIQKCKAIGIEARYGDLNEPLPFKDESFDVVVANQVLEHLYNTDLFITEIHRILKPSGYAIISTPNLAGWHNIACLFMGWVPFSVSLLQNTGVGNPLIPICKEPIDHYPEHYRIPTYRGLKEMLSYYGLACEKIVGTGYYPLPPGLISRLASYLDPRHSVILAIKVRKR